MGFYEDRILPRVVNRVMDSPAMGKLRTRTAAPLHGEVVEIGFGSGLTLPFYPEAVEHVHAIDPALLGRELAAERIAASAIPVTFAGTDGQTLDLPDDSMDGALCNWTLCTIPDAAQALGEILRVLKPGASLRFVEHGLHEDPKVARWQRRLNPLQNLLAGGCNINRPMDRLIRDAGFEITELETFGMPGPRIFTWMYLGSATKPG